MNRQQNELNVPGNRASEKGRSLNEIIADLQRHTAIREAVLATQDGLAIATGSNRAGRAAAMAGLLLATVRQCCAMLQMGTSNEVVIRGDEEQMLVARQFETKNSNLILVVLFSEHTPHRRMMDQVISQIKATIDK